MPGTYWFAGEAGGKVAETVHRSRDCEELDPDDGEERRPVSASVVGDGVEHCPGCFPDGGDGGGDSDDAICGYPTDSGQCQNSAGDDGSCHLDAHSPEE